MANRVVVTGIGIWSCIGTDTESVKHSLYAGKSGIGLEPERLEYGYSSALTGIVPEPVLTKKDVNRHLRAGRLLPMPVLMMNILRIMKLVASLATTHRLSRLLRLQT